MTRSRFFGTDNLFKRQHTCHSDRSNFMLKYPSAVYRLNKILFDRANDSDHYRRSLNSNHHLVKFFPRFVGGRMVMPSAQRAKGALIPAAIKSTRLVANADRPEGISAFPVSPILPHHQPPKPSTTRYTNPV